MNKTKNSQLTHEETPLSYYDYAPHVHLHDYDYDYDHASSVHAHVSHHHPSNGHDVVQNADHAQTCS